MTPAVTPAADHPFLRAIIDAPDDDLPRLIAADWLDEHGQPERAEFVRVQVELARRADPHGGIDVGVVLKATGKPQCRCRYCVLRRREWELLREHEQRWAAETFPPKLIHRTPDNLLTIDRWWFRCGFIDAVTLTAQAWLAHADAILTACPVRRVWRVDDRHPDGHWSGDGLVRLTTPPEAEVLTVGLIDAPRGWRGPARIRPQSPHREWQELGRPETDAAWRLALLAAEWPGVNFQLPTAARPDRPERPNWATITTTTPRHGTGRGFIYPPADLRGVIGAMERMARLTDDAE